MLPGGQYHLLSRANGHENIFLESKNHTFFLNKLKEHMLPVCRIYAYCLMPNHFHPAIEIRIEKSLQSLWEKSDPTKIERDRVIDISGGLAAFIMYQVKPINLKLAYLE